MDMWDSPDNGAKEYMMGKDGKCHKDAQRGQQLGMGEGEAALRGPERWEALGEL